jgi:hypothetical protein
MKSMSIEAYWDIIEDGTLGQMQREAATEIARHESLTGRELDDVLKSMSAHKRLSELEAMGVIRVKEVRACRITGREVEAWEMTGKKAEKPLGKKSTVAGRPTKAQLQRCLPSLRGLYLSLVSAKDPVASDIKQLGLWIAASTSETEPAPTPPVNPS